MPFVVACNAGVSCDSCMKGNFTGKRYKCLICYDYDLCASCYEAGTASSRHSPDHPMQCILTRADFGIFPLLSTYCVSETVYISGSEFFTVDQFFLLNVIIYTTLYVKGALFSHI